MTKDKSSLTPERGVMFLKTLALSYAGYYLFSYTSTCKTAEWLFYLWLMLLFEVALGLLGEVLANLKEFISRQVSRVQIVEFIWQCWGIYLVYANSCQDDMQHGINMLLLCFVGSTAVLLFGMALASFK